jgi:hypothetical protein
VLVRRAAAWARSASGSRPDVGPALSASSCGAGAPAPLPPWSRREPFDEPVRANQRCWAAVSWGRVSSASTSSAVRRAPSEASAVSTSVRRAMSAVSSATSCSSSRGELDEVVGEQPQPGVPHVGLDDAALRAASAWRPRGPSWRRISAVRSDPGEVGLHRLELAQRAFLALAVLEDPGGLLDEAAALLGGRPQDRVELALADDDVHLPADAGVETATPGRRAAGRTVPLMA